MPRVVRMMAHVETDLPRADITHVYLHGAAALRTRPDPGARGAPMSEPVRCVRPSPGPSRSSAPGCSAPRSALACRRRRPRGAADRRRRRSTCAPPPGLGAGRPRDRRRPARSWSSSRSRPTTSAPRSPRALRAADAVVTDVGSVKTGPLAAVAERRPASSGTSAATRWRAASAPARWPPAPRSSTAGPWAVTPHADVRPGRGRRWSRRWPGCAAPCRCG